MWKLFHKNGKKKKNTKNREFAVVTYSFLGLFLCLMGYFVYFEQVESEQFINNPYNKRQELFTRSVVRGFLPQNLQTHFSPADSDTQGCRGK